VSALHPLAEAQAEVEAQVVVAVQVVAEAADCCVCLGGKQGKALRRFLVFRCLLDFWASCDGVVAGLLVSVRPSCLPVLLHLDRNRCTCFDRRFLAALSLSISFFPDFVKSLPGLLPDSAFFAKCLYSQ
jgi:hypothetical protein